LLLRAGAQSSSAFQQALGGAGTSLSEQLAQLSAQREQSTISPLLQLLGTSTEGLVPKQKSFLQELLQALSGGVGSALGTGASSLLGGLL